MKKILFFLLVLSFFLIGSQKVEAIGPYCVCDFKGSGGASDKLGYKAQIDYIDECVATTKDSQVFTGVLGDYISEVSGCGMKMCYFDDGFVYPTTDPITFGPFSGAGKDVDWGVKSCVSYESFEGASECEKEVIFYDCDEMAQSQTTAKLSVCAAPCQISPVCDWDGVSKTCGPTPEDMIECNTHIPFTPEKIKACEGDIKACDNECKKVAQKCSYKDGVCFEGVAGATTSPVTEAVLSPSGAPSGAMSSEAILSYYEELYPTPKGYRKAGGALPDCAFSGTCRNVNDLLQLIINFGAGMFAIIGSFAFAFFVYGGFTIVTSFGNAERVKKGRDMMVAAVVGMVISLSAFLLVDFMLDALGVVDTFKAEDFR